MKKKVYFRKEWVNASDEELNNFSISVLKRIADYWLRKYLLATTPNKKGRYFCPIKKRHFLEEKIHVAHFIDRGCSMWTRYDLKNCHLISEASNVWDAKIQVEGFKSKHHKEYEEFLILTYGENIIEELKEKANNKKLMYKEDYINIIKNFQDECKSL